MITKNKVEAQLREVFSENGLEIFDGEEACQFEMDSLRFIAIIVAIEDAFSVEVPDEYLSNELLTSFDDFSDMIMNIIKKNSIS